MNCSSVPEVKEFCLEKEFGVACNTCEQYQLLNIAQNSIKIAVNHSVPY